jgi:hypothetical protein
MRPDSLVSNRIAIIVADAKIFGRDLLRLNFAYRWRQPLNRWSTN